ncbi:MAG TPA: hypothetical protein VMR34_02545 [Candidatus Saccharimonadales bacterium]|nr:hypothetical protein [Candidatus Saccharimonadales bacterium]
MEEPNQAGDLGGDFDRLINDEAAIRALTVDMSGRFGVGFETAEIAVAWGLKWVEHYNLLDELFLELEGGDREARHTRSTSAMTDFAFEQSLERVGGIGVGPKGEIYVPSVSIAEEVFKRFKGRSAEIIKHGWFAS